MIHVFSIADESTNIQSTVMVATLENHDTPSLGVTSQLRISIIIIKRAVISTGIFSVVKR